jgi:hypothetical protein
MKFDKSKIYTAVNAAELKIGSKVIVANNFQKLKEHVTGDATAVTIRSIGPEEELYRFATDDNIYALAYLVAEPARLKWSDLKIGDIICCNNVTAQVTAIDFAEEDECHIFAGDIWFSDDELKYWEKVK